MENNRMTEAEQKVKKWRYEGTLISKMLNFSKEEKEKYSEFIELKEMHTALLHYWTIKRLVSLKLKQKSSSDVENELSKLTQQQKEEMADFLNKELEKSTKKDYKTEINSIIDYLKLGQ